MPEEIIALRPHHIARFVRYYYNKEIFNSLSPVSSQTVPERYGKEFAKKYKDLFDLLSSGGTGEEYVLVRNGLDHVCQMCPIRKEYCSEPDSLSLWNGSGYVMQELNLREGFLYTLEEFLGKVKKLHDRMPVGM